MFLLLSFSFTPSPSYGPIRPTKEWPTPSPTWMPRRTPNPTKNFFQENQNETDLEENNETSYNTFMKACKLTRSVLCFSIALSIVFLLCFITCFYLSKTPISELHETREDSPPLLENDIDL